MLTKVFYLLHICVLSVCFSCCNSHKIKDTKKSTNFPQVEEDRPEPVMSNSYIDETSASNDPSEIILKASYTRSGGLINVPVRINEKLVYKNNKKVSETNATKTGSMSIEFTMYYNNKGLIDSTISTRSGKLAVKSSNLYTDDELLLEEMTIENNDGKLDTTVISYTYPKDRPNPMIFFKSRNGNRFAKIILTKKGLLEEEIEQSIDESKYYYKRLTTRKRNKQGKILEEQVTSINAGFGSNTDRDTLINAPSKFEYDQNGNIKSQESENLLGQMVYLKMDYNKDGVIEKKSIIKPGSKSSFINYEVVK